MAQATENTGLDGLLSNCASVSPWLRNSNCDQYEENSHWDGLTRYAEDI